uniref:VPS8 subunit of CORVET complex n=1 Tax=Astyanax mexicanus TaxID=7994 RepID=A0A8B9KGC5_ASTMX
MSFTEIVLKILAVQYVAESHYVLNSNIYTLLPYFSRNVGYLYFTGIDDKEFDIPQVDTPPTLESILNEPEDEDEQFILEDTCLLSTENIDAHSCETSSLASSDSGDRAHLKRYKQHKKLHGSVLRHSVLKGISAQIVSAADKVDAGLPTAITVSSVIAVGTSHGLALVFGEYQNQALRLCLGTTATGAEYGAVSALSINQDCTRLLCGFAKGQVFSKGLLIFSSLFLYVCVSVCRRVMGMRTCESRCLFSGSKGEVCCVEPLHSGPELKDHPITQYCLLAMASLTKILVIGLKPSLKVWMTFPYGKADPASVPQLAWQFVAVQKAVNPILAFCRGDTVHFLLVKKDESGTVHVIKQRQLQLSCDLISLTWLNPRTLVLMDSAEKLHVLDRASQEELEMLDLSEAQLVYNSSHFKSLATGGNVSQALVGEKACYQSVCSYGGQIVYLGTKSVHVMTLRNWRERVDHLLKQEKFTEALSLAWSVSLFFSFSLCLSFILAFSFLSVSIAVSYCLLLDLLFNQIYSRLVENSVAKGVFLESLEPYILSERIGCLTAPVMRDLLSYFQENGMMESVEGCLVHMDITNLDIQQVVQMCWDNQLYDAMIYVFNSGMNDYISPMEVIHTHIHSHTHIKCYLPADEQVVMGNKLLVYISCCLAGRAYPLGDIPEDLVPQVKNQVFEFLIRLHTVEATQEEEVYPYIRTLLHFDTREFLNVLALTFEDFKNDKQALEYQQRIVDILLKVMVDNSDFTPSQVGCLFTFLARQLAKPDNTLFVNRKLFDQVLEFLCSPDDDCRHTERQQVLLELLQVGSVVQFDEGRLLALAEKAEFYQICEFLYEQKHLYDRIIDCYLKDPLRKEEVYNLIHNILSMPGYSLEEKTTTWNKSLQHVKVRLSLTVLTTLFLFLVLISLSQALWFPLLEAMMSPQKLLKGPNAKHTSEALKELTMTVLNSMSSFIALPAIIQRILQDPVYGKGKLAEIQGLILGMLETFNYEQTLLETTTNLLNSDLHWSLAHLRKAVSRGLHPRQDHCNICLQQYKRRQESEEEVIIFSCGHLYHCQCLQRKEQGVIVKEPGLVGDRSQSWICYKCTSSQGSRPGERVSYTKFTLQFTPLYKPHGSVSFRLVEKIKRLVILYNLTFINFIITMFCFLGWSVVTDLELFYY